MANDQGRYRRLALEQGSQEWHAFRRTVIGASDAPTIMGENPWKSAVTLLKEKRGEGRTFSGNAATRRGAALEPVARRLYVQERRVQVCSAVLRSTVLEWQAASVDGIDDAGSVVVEIKCGKSAHGHLQRSGQVPQYYYGQLQHILCVTGLHEIDYFSYLPEHGRILLTVDRDEKYIERMIEAEERFWRQLRGTDSTAAFRLPSVAPVRQVSIASNADAPSEQKQADGARESNSGLTSTARSGPAIGAGTHAKWYEPIAAVPWWVWILLFVGAKVLYALSKVP